MFGLCFVILLFACLIVAVAGVLIAEEDSCDGLQTIAGVATVIFSTFAAFAAVQLWLHATGKYHYELRDQADGTRAWVDIEGPATRGS